MYCWSKHVATTCLLVAPTSQLQLTLLFRTLASTTNCHIHHILQIPQASCVPHCIITSFPLCPPPPSETCLSCLLLWSQWVVPPSTNLPVSPNFSHLSTLYPINFKFGLCPAPSSPTLPLFWFLSTEFQQPLIVVFATRLILPAE